MNPMLKELNIDFDSLTLEEALYYLKDSANFIIKRRKAEVEELKAQHSKLQDEIDKLLQNFIDGHINKEEYRKNHEELSRKRFTVIQNIVKIDNADDDHAELIIKLLKEAYANFKTSATVH